MAAVDGGWIGSVMSATVAVVDDGAVTAEALLGRLGRVEPRGMLEFGEAERLQGSFYEDGTIAARGVFQVGRVPGRGEWWGVVEPNGFRCSDKDSLLALAAGRTAVSVFWTVNSDMGMLRIEDGQVLAAFDPLLDVDKVPAEGQDLPFGVENPRAAAITLLERWTGVDAFDQWLLTPAATYTITTSPVPVWSSTRTPSPERSAKRSLMTPGRQSRHVRAGDPSWWRVTLTNGTTIDVWAESWSKIEGEQVFQLPAERLDELPEDALITERAPRLQIAVARFPLASVAETCRRPPDAPPP